MSSPFEESSTSKPIMQHIAMHTRIRQRKSTACDDTIETAQAYGPYSSGHGKML